jgi:ribonuclease HI
VLKYKDKRKELSEGFRLTTNNRMELLAVIRGLQALKKDNLDVTIYSDSKYVVEAVRQGWIWSWLKKGFKNKKNEDLWREFISLYNKHNVQFRWVKGHAGNRENERCDALAVGSAEGSDLKVDRAFEAGMK